MFAIKRKVVRAFIYTPQKKKILVIKSYIANFFSLPGGGVKEGESERHALIRELEEELGIPYKELKEVTCIKKLYSEKTFFFLPLKSSISLFNVELRHNIRVKPSWEIRIYQWVNKNDVSKFLKKYFEKPF